MTTQTKAKRTEGGLEMYETNDGHFALEGRTSDRRRVRVANCQNAADAEYIRKAWNMHEELVDRCREIISWSTIDDLKGVQLRVLDLLAKVQP